MYVLIRAFCLFISIILSTSIVFGKLLFTVTNFNTCLSDELNLRTIVGISLLECVIECGKRRSCEYIGYARYGNLCQLYTGFDSAFTVEGNCLLVSRGYIENSILSDDCTCDEGLVCNEGEVCRYKECKQLSITNGEFIGNRKYVAAKLKTNCEPGYVEVNSRISVTCGISGNWSYVPSCIATIVCDDITVANGDLFGTGNGVGSVRTISCDTGYEERTVESSIQCDITGNWNYIPTCSLIIVCNDITIANGDLIGTGNGVGAQRTIVCNTYYEETSGQTSITCDSSGNWNHIPVCNIACPSANGYSKDGFNIQIYMTELNWDDAKSSCSGSGGKLVKIDQGWKIDFINDKLTSCSAYSSYNDYWTDGRPVNGKYRFADNTLVQMNDPQFWKDGKPDDYENDDCLRLEDDGGVYLWDDRGCTRYSFRFICEY